MYPIKLLLIGFLGLSSARAQACGRNWITGWIDSRFG
jgi:hypothetical protein